MTDSETNANEGADPSGDVAAQNAGTGGPQGGEDRAGAGEGADAGEDGSARDEGERAGGGGKARDLARAGRDDVDPDAGQE